MRAAFRSVETGAVLVILLPLLCTPRLWAISAAFRSDTPPLPRLLDLEQLNITAIVKHGDALQTYGWDGEQDFVAAEHAAGLRLSVWDPQAAVFVSAGKDGQPGMADVDDDGNGAIDDRLELGATGSDDPVLTPEHPEYASARSGRVPALLLSRGAMRPVEDGAVIQGPAQVRIDRISPQGQLTSRILDLREVARSEASSL